MLKSAIEENRRPAVSIEELPIALTIESSNPGKGTTHAASHLPRDPRNDRERIVPMAPENLSDRVRVFIASRLWDLIDVISVCSDAWGWLLYAVSIGFAPTGKR